MFTLPFLCILLFAIAALVWSGWTPADQTLVRGAAIHAAKLQTQLVRKLFAENVEKVTALGGNVHVPSAPEMNDWQVATCRTYARWKAQVHPQPISKIEEIVAGTRKALQLRSRPIHHGRSLQCHWTTRCSPSWCVWST